MDKTTAINKMIEALKPRVICKFPKERQSKVFRAICKDAFAICTQYTKAMNAGILREHIRIEKARLYQAAFKYGQDHWTKEAAKEVIALIGARPWWWRVWWAINPGKMELPQLKNEVKDGERENDGGSGKEDNSV